MTGSLKNKKYLKKFKKKKKGGCSVIRACSLIRSNTVVVCSPLTSLQLVGDVLKQTSELDLVLLEDRPTEVGQT